MPLRVVYDLRGAQAHDLRYAGGIARWVEGLARTLAARDDVELFGLAEPGRELPPTGLALAAEGRIVGPHECDAIATSIDVHHVTSPFEFDLRRPQLLPPALSNAHVARVVTLYDAIPLVPELQFDDGLRRAWRKRAEVVRDAALILTLTRYVAADGAARLGFDAHRARVVGTGIPDHGPPATAAELARALPSLEERFVLYTGGAADPRKNVAGLIEAFGRLGPDLRESHQLVIASWVPEAVLAVLEQSARDAGVEDRVLLCGWVRESVLAALFAGCQLVAYPSRNEGFGYPIAEAMAAGAAVLAGRGTSSGEVLGHPGATFEADDPADIARVLERTLRDEGARAALAQYGRDRARSFSWEDTADRVVAAYAEAAGLTGRRSLGRAGSRPRRVLLATYSPPVLGTAARALLTTAEAMAARAQVTIAGLGTGGSWAGLGRIAVNSLATGAYAFRGPLACLVDSAVVATAATHALTLRPGVAVLWTLDPVLADPDALAAVCAAACAVVVRDELDAVRLERAVGRGMRRRMRVIAPPLAWAAPVAGMADRRSTDLALYADGDARAAVGSSRRLPLVCGLRAASHGVFPPGTVERAARLSEELTARGVHALLRLAGGYTGDDVDAARSRHGGRLPGRLVLSGPPAHVELVALATAAEVHIAFADDSHSVAEQLTDVALISRRPVVVLGGPGPASGGITRIARAARPVELADAVVSALAGPEVETDPRRSPGAVAAALLELMEDACRPRVTAPGRAGAVSRV